MEPRKLITEYLAKARVMQLATAANNQPWVCTVHFWADEHLNLYWMSTPARRHSQEIAQNQNVAAAILVHEDTAEEQYIAGISLEGTATLIDQTETKAVIGSYINKLGKNPSLEADILEGRNPHQFYRLTPSRITLCDTKTFPDQPWQKLNLDITNG